MPHRVRRSHNGALTGAGPCVLTVFASASRRTQVLNACTAQTPMSRTIDVSTPTDAVLALLCDRVDLVLVDLALAGDLLPALALHARRSAPEATLLGFDDEAAQARKSAHGALAREVFPWHQLTPVLTRWLRNRCDRSGK